MTAQKKNDTTHKGSANVGMNEHNAREHAERVSRDKERLKDPNLNEFDKNEIRERLARENKG